MTERQMKKGTKGSRNILLYGVRQNNLKGFDLELPAGNLVVLTGLSGSGKSSLAFDTLFAEGQRRYVETFSPYARQFFDRMDKPQVDRIQGIPPAIAIEQRNTVRSTRSTVGTMTEICDHMKVLWSHLATLYCSGCGNPVKRDSPRRVWEAIRAFPHGRDHSSQARARVLVTFELPLSEKLSLEDSLGLIRRQGYQRLLVDSGESGQVIRESPYAFEWNRSRPKEEQALEIIDVDSAVDLLRARQPERVIVIQDRVALSPSNRARFVEACEQAYHFGKGHLEIYPAIKGEDGGQWAISPPWRFSQGFHCAECDLDFREPTPALFSFNHPLGACPSCRGFGRVITIDYRKVIPDRTKSLRGGAIKPWRTGHSAECHDDLMAICNRRRVPTDIPFNELKPETQKWVIEGDPDYGKNRRHEWPNAWYGIARYFRWLESKAYKMHVRVLLSRYRGYQLCPDCHGRRLQSEALQFKVRGTCAGENALGQERPPASRRHGGAINSEAKRGGRDGSNGTELNLAEFYALPLRDAYHFVQGLSLNRGESPSEPLRLVLQEVESRLKYLLQVGLSYLTLDRPTRSLSGGETERVNLTACLGTRLVNTLYILDEPSVGLHPRDIDRLVSVVQHLRDLGNTVVVVEHEARVIKSADQIVELGPGQGEAGGRLVFQGTYKEMLRQKGSLTGDYLSDRKRVPIPKRRPIATKPEARSGSRGSGACNEWMTLSHASLHNLHDVTVSLPLERLVCVTGVSGSGKTSLVRGVLLPVLQQKLEQSEATATADNEPEEESDEVVSENGQAEIFGADRLHQAVMVDQSSLGKTPRSNPAVYIGAFGDIRELFARSDEAKTRGLKASAFSFNSPQGQCERCRGAGFEKIEMQFLSDVFIRCPDCNGSRYRAHILEVRLNGELPQAGAAKAGGKSGPKQASKARSSKKRPAQKGRSAKTMTTAWNIADLLDATADESIAFLRTLPASRYQERAIRSLNRLQEVGLGYLRLGQPINTLSGGECQRLKLVRHLAEFDREGRHGAAPTLFLFDEPTTGLHFEDIRILMQVFQRLVDAGHTVLVIEHNLDVVKCADWVIDLGPDAGDQGGRLVAEGPPETVAACSESHTGKALEEHLPV